MRLHLLLGMRRDQLRRGANLEDLVALNAHAALFDDGHAVASDQIVSRQYHGI